MKKNNFIWELALILVWIVQPAFGIEYAIDFLESGNAGGWSGSSKTFDTEWWVSSGDTFYADIWLHNVPEELITAGFLIDYDASMVSVAGSDVYDGSLPGPWDGDMTNKVTNPSGSGTYMVIVGNLGATSPDSAQDLPIARMQFTYASTGNAMITIRTVSDFDTVVGNSETVYDSQIAHKSVTISQGQGTSTTSSSSTTTSSTASSSTDSTSTTTSASADSDSDGISDNQDNCPETPNGPDAGTCIWASKIGEPCSIGGSNKWECEGYNPYCSMNQEDTDRDGVGNACDNCPSNENPEQEDADCDGIGDVCDSTPICTKGVYCDADCDDILDKDDNCPHDSNADQVDTDSDGVGDVCDNCRDKPNGPDKGTCTEGTEDNVGKACMSNEQCGIKNGMCSLNQDDADEDQVGDACDDRIMLSVSDGAGDPGSTNRPVAVNLDNSENIVQDVQVNLCDDDNYLTCTACETTSRTSGYSCSFNEVDGCCMVMLENPTSDATSIAKGTGAIFTIKYNVSQSAPSADSKECREVKPSDEKVTTDNSVLLPADSKLGKFCFYTPTTTTTAYQLEVEAYAPRLCRSFWFPLPYLLIIQSKGFDFPSSNCRPDFFPSGVLCDFPIGRISESYFWDMILVWPGVMRGLKDEDDEMSIVMTWDDIVATGTFTIESCGF